MTNHFKRYNRQHIWVAIRTGSGGTEFADLPTASYEKHEAAAHSDRDESRLPEWCRAHPLADIRRMALVSDAELDDYESRIDALETVIKIQKKQIERMAETIKQEAIGSYPMGSISIGDVRLCRRCSNLLAPTPVETLRCSGCGTFTMSGSLCGDCVQAETERRREEEEDAHGECPF